MGTEYNKLIRRGSLLGGRIIVWTAKVKVMVFGCNGRSAGYIM